MRKPQGQSPTEQKPQGSQTEKISKRQRNDKGPTHLGSVGQGYTTVHGQRGHVGILTPLLTVSFGHIVPAV